MKILVTGGAGFIGSNLALKLESMKHEVTIVDDFRTGKKENINFFKGKVIESNVLNLHTYDDFKVIFHQAAITDAREDNAEDLKNINVIGFKHILDIAENLNAKVIYASSAAVYGNGQVPMQEDQYKHLLTPYAESKQMMDNIAKRNRKVHIIGLRYFNVFGPHEQYKGRAASMFYHLAQQYFHGETPQLFEFGDQKRDHIYVDDVVEANLKAMECPTPGIFNVGTGIATSFNQMILLFNEYFDRQKKPKYIKNPWKSTYQDYTLADTNLAESVLKFKAKHQIKDAMKEYMRYLLCHTE